MVEHLSPKQGAPGAGPGPVLNNQLQVNMFWFYMPIKRLVRRLGYEMTFTPAAERYPRDFDSVTKEVIDHV